VSIQDLRPNPQDTSAFYLGEIYQLLADPNISRVSILSTQATPPPFSPPSYAIWVNSLWILSLVISITCALLATLLQQWARRYVTVTQPLRSSPHKRARIRTFFADGVDKLHLPSAVEVLPTLLHTSLFLFFSGLLIFLFNIHHTVFTLVAWWIGLSGGIYGCVTLMPIFRLDSPYYAPLSLSAWSLYTGLSYGILRILELIPLFSYVTSARFYTLTRTYRKRLLDGLVKTAQETASKLSAEIDRQALRWTFESLDEDHELEQFFEGIPGFCSSKEVTKPRRVLAGLGDRTLAVALAGLLNRTWSSSLLSQPVKERRLMVCIQAAGALDLQILTSNFLFKNFKQGVDGVILRSVQLGHSLRPLCHSGYSGTALYAQAIVACIIARAPERDYRWKALVMDQFRISEAVLRSYLAHGDSVLLANLTHITRQFFRFYLPSPSELPVMGSIEEMISKFDLRNTLPELQHDFCALWNEIILKARENETRRIPFWILRPIRHVYIALHQGTDDAPTAFDASNPDNDSILGLLSSYPMCNIPNHHSHINEVDVDAADETIHITSPTVSPPDHNHLHSTDELSLYDVPHSTSVIEPLQPSPTFNVENNHIVATSLESVTCVATQDPAAAATISPTVSSRSESDPRPDLAASTSVVHVSFTLPSSSAVSP
jgi:Family of unknown function (DUF6535)